MEKLCEFKVKKVITTEVPVEREIDGKTLKVMEKVSHFKELPFCLIKPKRKIVTGADIFFASKVNEYMGKGLMSVHMISKRYDDEGGPFSKQESELLDKLQNRKIEVSAIYFKNKLSVQKKEMSEEEFKETEKLILQEVKKIQDDINEIQRPYLSIFNQTAEYKAKNDSYYWWLFSLFHVGNENGTEFHPYFKTKDFDKNLEELDNIDETGEPYFKNAIQKGLFLIGAWVNGSDLTKDLEELLKDFDSTSEYLPEIEVMVENAVSEKVTANETPS